jgi:hypothetical protein
LGFERLVGQDFCVEMALTGGLEEEKEGEMVLEE